MIELKIDYKPTFWGVPLKSAPVTKSVPASWDEIPKPLRPKILKALCRPLPEFSRRLYVLQTLLQMPLRLFFKLDQYQVYDLLRAFKFLENLVYKPRKTLAEPIKAPVYALEEKFKLKGRTYYFPGPGFDNGAAGEFLYASHYFTKYQETQDPINLDKLLAVLARPADRDKKRAQRREDIRTPIYSRTQAEEQLKKMGRIPERLRVCAGLYFQNCKALVYDIYAEWLFTAAPADDEPGLDLGWEGVFFDLAENGTFGPLEDVLQYNFHKICLYLAKLKEAQRKARRKNTSIDG